VLLSLQFSTSLLKLGREVTLLFFEWSKINKCKGISGFQGRASGKSCSKKSGAEKQVSVVDWNFSRVANLVGNSRVKSWYSSGVLLHFLPHSVTTCPHYLVSLPSSSVPIVLRGEGS